MQSGGGGRRLIFIRLLESDVQKKEKIDKCLARNDIDGAKNAAWAMEDLRHKVFEFCRIILRELKSGGSLDFAIGEIYLLKSYVEKIKGGAYAQAIALDRIALTQHELGAESYEVERTFDRAMEIMGGEGHGPRDKISFLFHQAECRHDLGFAGAAGMLEEALNISHKLLESNGDELAAGDAIHTMRAIAYKLNLVSGDVGRVLEILDEAESRVGKIRQPGEKMIALHAIQQERKIYASRLDIGALDPNFLDALQN